MILASCAHDVAALLEALRAAGLPADDLDDDRSLYFALSVGGVPTAFGGIAGTGPDRLLRSIVVPEAARRTGIGSRVAAMLADRAQTDGAARLWLLTTDAAGFFARLGWITADRESAPVAIRESRQFASICPASAVLMVRDLTQ